MRLLVDMNLSPRWADFLRAAGHEATHWSEIGDATATDAHIMAVAADQFAVVLTNDLDFGTILAARGHSGPSVIQLRTADLRPEALGDLLLAAITQVAEELEDGALVTIDPGRTGARAPLDHALAPRRPEAPCSRECSRQAAIARVRGRPCPCARAGDLRRRIPVNGCGRVAETWGSRGRRFKSGQP